MKSFKKFLTEHLRNEILYKLLIENGLNLPDDWMDRLYQGPAPKGGMYRAKNNPNSPIFHRDSRNSILKSWNNGQRLGMTTAMTNLAKTIRNNNLHNHPNPNIRKKFQEHLKTAEGVIRGHEEFLEYISSNSHLRETIASAVDDHRKEADKNFAGTRVRYPYLLHDHKYYGLTRPEIMEKFKEENEHNYKLIDEYRNSKQATPWNPQHSRPSTSSPRNAQSMSGEFLEMKDVKDERFVSLNQFELMKKYIDLPDDPFGFIGLGIEKRKTHADKMEKLIKSLDQERGHIMGNQPHRDEITKYPPMPDGTADWRAPVD